LRRRDLGDVLHYFIPEAGEAASSAPRPAAPRPPGSGPSVTAVPLGHRDVLRATFVWNLAVEMTAQGAPTTVVVPSRMSPPVWPEPGRMAMGAELVPVLAEGLGDLARAALDVAVTGAADMDRDTQVLVCIPPAWLRKAADGAPVLRRVLLFASPDPTELIEAYALAKHLFAGAGDVTLGVTIYGVQQVETAARAFERLAGTAEQHLGCKLTSYGLLVDELQIYRAIVERKPIGVSHPQSRAARSLRDVARLLLDDLTPVSA
jgi:hypothetical protein